MQISKVQVRPECVNMTKVERVCAMRPTMDKYKKEFAQPSPPRANLRDNIYRDVQSFGLAEFVKVTVQKMGTHPRNRSKTVLDEANLEVKLIGLHTGGLSLSELARAVAIKRPHGAKGHEWEKRCAEIAKKSNGKIAEVMPESLECFTICCNHTKEALRCIYYGTRSDNPVYALDGKVALAQFQGRGASFADALENGIYVLMIDPEVEDAHPWLIDELMEADNVTNQLATKDSDLALMRRSRKKRKQCSDGWR